MVAVLAAVQSRSDMQSRAATLLQLSLYGARSQAPLSGQGARADLGTEFMKESCPIVQYHYKNGRPVMLRDPTQGKVGKGEKVRLIQKVTPITTKGISSIWMASAVGTGK